MRIRILRPVMAGALAALAASTAPAAAQTAVGAQAERISFSIPAQDVARALELFGRQSGKSVLFNPAGLAQVRSRPLKGRFTADEAIRRLLAGSGLVARKAGASSYVVETAAAGGGEDSEGPPAIVVTGSRIEGAESASTVVTQTAQDMRRRGYANLGEVVRDLPQSFGGGQNPGVGNNVPSARGTDVNGGSSLNLRGLGSDATLTLLDGQRLSFSAAVQSVDISAIPFRAVERLEIVPDGASAIYGSDAVAGVANIILRRKMEGGEAGLRLGSSTEGGNFTQQYWATTGLNWDTGNLVATYEYNDGSGVSSEQRDYAESNPGLTLFPAMRSHNAALAGTTALGPSLTFDLDAIYNLRWSDQVFPVSSAGGSATFSTRTESFALLPSFKLALSPSWTLTAAATYGRERVEYGQVECDASGCADTGDGYYRNTEKSVTLGASGSLFPLPGGEARLAVGGGYRQVGFTRYALNGGAVNTDYSQDSSFAYGEVNLPLIGPAQGLALVERFVATGAVRYERYPGVGDVATPKLGLIYAPTDEIEVKGTWGRSYRAPTLYDQHRPRTVVVYPSVLLGDPTAMPGSAALYVVGGNPDLEPERATTWSAGVSYRPRWSPGARIEVSYFDVAYRDRVVSPIAFASQALSNPLYASQLTYDPDAVLQNALIASAATFLNATGAPYDPNAIVAIVDNASVNAGRQRARGVDILGAYRHDFATEEALEATVNVSYLESDQQLTSSQPVVPLAGRIFSPPHWRAQAGLAWSNALGSLSTTVHYTGSILDSRTAQPVRVGGMVTWDVSGQVSLVDAGLLDGLDIGITVSNLLNAEPNAIATSLLTDTPYDSTNFSPLGRVISVALSRKW